MKQGADVLIIGAGCAGLFAALKMSGLRVAVAMPFPLGEGAASLWAQGGIAAANGAGDSPALHAQDSLAASGGIGDEAIALRHAEEINQRIADLSLLGVAFDRTENGRLQLGHEAAHQKSRTVRVGGDYAGRAIMGALTKTAQSAEHIEFLSEHRALGLVSDAQGISGVWLSHCEGAPFFFPVRAVLLASGGIGHLFDRTTNPAGAMGEGLGMAASAGAVIADAEFVQFHASALDVGKDPAPLASEALRGEGAYIIDESGARFLQETDTRGELAPRDITARALAQHLAGGHKAFLDVRHLAKNEAFAQHFSVVFDACRAAGLNPAHDLLPIVSAAHYHMGGVRVDAEGASSLRGLWACGEVAGSGLHGANRLAGNALGEALVLAGRAAEAIAHFTKAPEGKPAGVPPSCAMLTEKDEAALRRTMSAYAGLMRDETGLQHALDFILALKRDYPEASRAGNVLWAAHFIVAAALQRCESRGAHYRRDFPNPDPAFANRSFLTIADFSIS